MNDTNSITVDIDDILDKLYAIKEDDFSTVKLELVGDEYSQELSISAISFDSESPIGYGTVMETSEEI